MDSAGFKRRKVFLLIPALIITVWGAIGFVEQMNFGYSGGLYGPEYIVEGIIPGGAAEKAGLRPGDRVVSVEGRPIEEIRMESRWPRSLVPRIGETRRFVVEREGKTIPIDVIYESPSSSALRLRTGAAAVVLSFMVLGLWAFFTTGTTHGLALACIGLAAGAIAQGPHLGTWNGVPYHIQAAAAVLVFVLLLWFFLRFPRPKQVSESRLATLAVYGPWFLFLGFLVLELIVHPRLYLVTGTVASLMILGYVFLTLAAVAHTVVKTPGRELRESGMGLILVGLLVAIVGTLLPVFGPILFSGLRRPSVNLLPLLIVTVPLTMALAVRKHAREFPNEETGA